MYVEHRQVGPGVWQFGVLDPVYSCTDKLPYIQEAFWSLGCTALEGIVQRIPLSHASRRSQ